MMDVKLVVVGGKHAGKEIACAGPRYFIGRAEDCQLRPQSEQVSRHHAAILMDTGFVAVRDLGSRNGTFVNGEQVLTEKQLKNGDRLKLGPLEFEIELAVSLSGRKRPKVENVSQAAARTVEAASESDSEINIFNLLGEDDDVDTTPSSDTIYSEVTAEINQQATDTVTNVPTTPSPPPAPEPQTPPPAATQESKSFSEQLEQKEKEKPHDTRSAAEEALRRFMSQKK